MHTIADARRFIPATQKLPVLSSRGREEVTKSIRSHLNVPLPWQGKKVCGCTYSFGIAAPSLIKGDRSVRDADLA
jgi:hypothetical protein